MRVFHSAAMGCVPVLVQRDERSAYPPVLQAYEGLLLNWDEFTVRIEPPELPNLPAILRRLAAARRRSARSATPLHARGRGCSGASRSRASCARASQGARRL